MGSFRGWCRASARCQLDRSTTTRAKRVRASRTGPSGRGASAATACSDHSSARRRVASVAAWSRRRPRRIVQECGVGAVGDAGDAVVDRHLQFARRGVGGAAEQEVRHRRDAGAQVGAGHLAGLLGVGRQVDDVIQQLEGDADLLAELQHGVLVLVRRTGEHDAGLGGGGDERAGLVGEHLDVELHGVIPRLRADRLVHLPEHQPLERVGLHADGPLADLRHELARAGEEQVAGEDGDAVAPHGVRARHPAADVRAVHDVVVVQRPEVGHLERRGAGDDVVVHAPAELRREQRQHGAQALAAGLVQVAGRGVGERVADAQLDGQSVLDTGEPVLDDGGELPHPRPHEDALGHAEAAGQLRAGRVGSRGHPDSLPGCARARSAGRGPRLSCAGGVRGAARRCRRTGRDGPRRPTRHPGSSRRASPGRASRGSTR